MSHNQDSLQRSHGEQMSLPDHFTFTLTSRQMKDLEGAMLFDRGKHADSLTEYPDGSVLFSLNRAQLEDLVESLAFSSSHPQDEQLEARLDDIYELLAEVLGV